MKVNGLLCYLGFEPKKENSQIRINCVDCEDEKKHLYISIEKGLGFCQKCGYKMNLWKLVKHVNPDMAPANVSELLQKYGVPVSFAVRDMPRPKIKPKQFRPITDDELKQLAETKQLDIEALKKFQPYIKANEPIALLPAHYPKDKRACSILRVRLDGELIETRNGPQKYPMWYGGTHGLFGLRHIEDNSPDTIVLCEAWRDALAVMQQGFFATASSGGASTFQAAWLPLFVDKDVLVCTDADAAGAKFSRIANEYITRVAKSCKIIHLPYEIKDKQGKDLHDYLVVEGHSFKELIENQGDITVELPEKEIMLPDKHPVTLARAFVKHTGRILKHHRLYWLEYTGNGYRTVDQGEMVKSVWRFITLCRYDTGREFKQVPATEPIIKTILSALSSLKSVWIRSTVELPVWVGPAPAEPEDLVVVHNGILDVSGPEPVLLPHTSDYISTASSPVVYDPAATCDAWRSFLPEVICSSQLVEVTKENEDGIEVKIQSSAFGVEADQAEIDLLMEFMGLLLVPVTKYHKILGLVGPKRSGKGTITRIMHKLIGKDNCTMPTLGSLATQGGLQSLMGKSAAIITDASSGGRKMDMPACVERLKNISGEDMVTIDPKHREPIDLPKLPTRFVLTANSIQMLSDATGALASRFLFVQTGQSFYGSEDLDLEKKLSKELSGILNYAIESLYNLRKRGRFSESERGVEARSTAESLGSPVMAFYQECCDIREGVQTERKIMYQAYERWVREANRGLTSKNKFYEEFVRALPQHPLGNGTGELNGCKVFYHIDIHAEYLSDREALNKGLY